MNVIEIETIFWISSLFSLFLCIFSPFWLRSNASARPWNPYMNSRAFPLPLNSDNIPHNSIQYSYTNRKHFSANDFQKSFFLPVTLFSIDSWSHRYSSSPKKSSPSSKPPLFRVIPLQKRALKKSKPFFPFIHFFFGQKNVRYFFIKIKNGYGQEYFFCYNKNDRNWRVMIW